MVISDYYYNELTTTAERTEFREIVTARTGMRYSTFYTKLAADNFRPAEREVIQNIIKERQDA